MAMYRTGDANSSSTTSAEVSPCGLPPEMSSATAGLAASAEWATGSPVSGARGRPELPLSGDERPPGVADAEEAPAVPTGLGGPVPHPATATPVKTATPATTRLVLDRDTAGPWRCQAIRHRQCLVARSAGAGCPSRVRGAGAGGPVNSPWER